MNPIKRLIGQTGIYGGMTIIGRFLNWLLVPLYTNIFPTEEYGVVISLMAATAIAQVILTYGTETGYFRFATDPNAKQKLFPSLVICLFFTSTIFLAGVLIFSNKICNSIGVAGNDIFVKWLGFTLFYDILCSIPFAKLRLENKAIKFGIIKLINILINIGINLFFLVLCPYVFEQNPNHWLLHIYDPGLRIGYIFLGYLVSAFFTFLILLPEFFSFKYVFDFRLILKVLKYSYPILIVSLAGMINTQIDKNLLARLLPEKALVYTGIYGANYKLGVVMVLFISAFRYAYEPFFFSQKKNLDAKIIYAKVLTYFAFFGVLLFLFVMFYLDIFKHFIGRDYHSGLRIVPFILGAHLFQGIFYSLSVWYKLTDKTIYGACLSIGGVVITLSLNFLLIPVVGYMGSAYAVLTCFLAMSVASYLLGKKHYPIPYDVKRLVFYLLIGGILFALSKMLELEDLYVKLSFNSFLLIVYLLIFYKKEKLSLASIIFKKS